MNRHPLFGVFLAAVATLILTPDALFMRLSGMDGYQMVGWRGMLMGSVMLIGWLLLSRRKGRDVSLLFSGLGLLIVTCQYFNATLFAHGIARAPVAVVLFGVAAVPVFAAVFARVVMGEPTYRATWITMVAVIGGIGIAVFSENSTELQLNGATLFGAAAGLGVAATLAINFVVLRAQPELPILLLIGSGAVLAGGTGIWITGPAEMLEGQVWAILIAGGIILPISFFSLSLASRYTHASNVSLLMLLETVLGPLWVWWGIGEAVNTATMLGGIIVVISLATYLIHVGRISGTSLIEASIMDKKNDKMRR